MQLWQGRGGGVAAWMLSSKLHESMFHSVPADARALGVSLCATPSIFTGPASRNKQSAEMAQEAG